MEILIISPILLFAATLSVVAYKRKHKRNKQIAASETKPYQPPEFKPYGTERTVDGQKYKYHDGFWFLQFPFDDEISLELAVGMGNEWIKTIEPFMPLSDENACYPISAYSVERRNNWYVTSNDAICRINAQINRELVQSQMCCNLSIHDELRQSERQITANDLQAWQIIQALRPIPMPYYQYPPYHPPFIPQGGYCASQYPYAYSPWGCRSSW